MDQKLSDDFNKAKAHVDSENAAKERAVILKGEKAERDTYYYQRDHYGSIVRITPISKKYRDNYDQIFRRKDPESGTSESD